MTAAAHPTPSADLSSGWNDLSRHVAASGLAGLLAGLLIGGLGSRLFMRVAGAMAPSSAQGATTEAGEIVGRISLDGTIALVIPVGLFAGIIGAVMYVVFRPWLGWAGRWSGLAFGVVLLAAGSATSDILNPDNRDFVILRNERVVVVAMIVALFLGFGWAHDRLFRWLDRRLPQGGAPTRLAYTAVDGLGLFLALGLLPATIFTGTNCDCDPPLLVGISITAAAAGTALWWLGRLRRTRVLDLAARTMGWSGLFGVVCFGLFRAVSDAVEVLS